MYLIRPSTSAHWSPGEEVMAMADDVDVPVCRVTIDSTSDYRERVSKR